MVSWSGSRRAHPLGGLHAVAGGHRVRYLRRMRADTVNIESFVTPASSPGKCTGGARRWELRHLEVCVDRSDTSEPALSTQLSGGTC